MTVGGLLAVIAGFSVMYGFFVAGMKSDGMDRPYIAAFILLLAVLAALVVAVLIGFGIDALSKSGILDERII